jgi:hypothetical protein
MVQWTIRCIKEVIKLIIKGPSANEIKGSGIGRKTKKTINCQAGNPILGYSPQQTQLRLILAIGLVKKRGEMMPPQ